MTRNILATNPRVTRFKIDWDDNQTENGENIPPESNLESESNQMCVDSAQISKTLTEKQNQVVPEVNINGSAMNSNSMETMEQSVSMS